MDTIDEIGFLSPQIHDWIKQNRARNGEWFSLCDNLNKFAQYFLLSLTPPRRDRRLIVAATVFSRVVSHFQAIILLAERGMTLEARTIARSALEAAFTLGALLKDETFIDDYAKDDEAQRKRYVRSLLKLSDSQISAHGIKREDLERLLEKIDKTIKEKGIRKLTVKETAERAGMKDHYDTLYALLSPTVHTRVRDLERGVIMDAEGLPEQIQWGPEPDPGVIREILVAACDIMFMALRATIDLSRLSVDESFATLQAEYSRLLEAYVKMDRLSSEGDAP